VSQPTLLIADPDTIRRKELALRCADLLGTSVICASGLSAACVQANSHRPQWIVIAAEIAEAPGFPMLGRILNAIDAKFLVYGRAGVIETGGRDLQGDPVFAILLNQLPKGCGRPCAGEPAGALRNGSVNQAVDCGDPLILIGASTGGITALETVLASFPADCPPTLVVQHIRPGFAEGLIRRLDQMLAPTVRPAADNMPLRRGTIHVAADSERHLGLALRAGARTRLLDGPPVSGHRPSVDVLFGDGAVLAPKLDVRAALLTGMGSDGASGMCALRRVGAFTIAQDRESSVVWGMPRVAVEMGGASDVLPLSRIGPALLRRPSSASTRSTA